MEIGQKCAMKGREKVGEKEVWKVLLQNKEEAIGQAEAQGVRMELKID